MNSKILRVIAVVLLTTILGAACSGTGSVRSGMSVQRGIYYHNPWDRYDYPRFPRIVRPPPIILPPPPIFEAVPLPS